MKKYEKDYIISHRTELVKMTTINVTVISELRAKGLIEDDDEEALDVARTTKGPNETARLMYNIVSRNSKETAYNDLIVILTRARQSGAVTILEELIPPLEELEENEEGEKLTAQVPVQVVIPVRRLNNENYNSTSPPPPPQQLQQRERRSQLNAPFVQVDNLEELM